MNEEQSEERLAHCACGNVPLMEQTALYNLKGGLESTRYQAVCWTCRRRGPQANDRTSAFKGWNKDRRNQRAGDRLLDAIAGAEK